MEKIPLFLACLSFLSFDGLAKSNLSHHQTITSVTQGTPNLSCPQFQIFGYPITVNAKILRRAFYTCRIGYAGLYHPYERTPLWVAERLVKENLSGFADRKGLDFFADPDIPRGALPKSTDYSGSGYDQGHMAPSGDFKYSQHAMNESFQFGNAVPQTPESNRKIWKSLEEATREFANRRGELYVVTGPIYSNIVRKKINNSVSVPDATFKILIDHKVRSMTGLWFLIHHRLAATFECIRQCPGN